jgi:hypothetical protein
MSDLRRLGTIGAIGNTTTTDLRALGAGGGLVNAGGIVPGVSSLLQYVAETGGDRVLNVTATLRSLKSGSGITMAGLECGVASNLVNFSVITYTRVSGGSTVRGWYVSYVDENGIDRAIIDEHTADSATTTFSVTLTGTRKRYAMVYDPDIDITQTALLRSEVLSEARLVVADYVLEYEVEITLGATTRTFTIDATADDPTDAHRRYDDIQIEGIATVPIVYALAYDGNNEPYLTQTGDNTYSAPCSLSTEWITGTYSRSPGNPCSRERSYQHTISGNYGCTVTLGDGAFSLVGGSSSALPVAGATFRTDFAYGAFAFHDRCGAYSISLSPDIHNIDGATRSLSVRTVERHPRTVETSYAVNAGNGFVTGSVVNYNGDTGPIVIESQDWEDEEDVPIEGLVCTSSGLTVEYGGAATFNAVCSSLCPLSTETYEDLNSGWAGTLGVLLHGDSHVLGVKPTWAGTAYTEGTAREEAHPPWTPLPTQAQGGEPPAPLYEESGEPIWDETSDNPPRYDDQALCDNAYFALDDALTVTVPAPGATLEDPSLTFAGVGLTWLDENCTAYNDTGNSRLSITANADVTGAYAELDGVFDLNIRLTGPRFARLDWWLDNDHKDAECRIWLGANAWDIQGDGVNNTQTTIIDLCCPSYCETSGGPQQSIIDYELPFDQSLSGSPPTRQSDDYAGYRWDFPTGWGVGRLTRLKIEPKTANAEYRFTELFQFRKAIEDGGSCKLYVAHQAGPWNRSLEMNDFSLFNSGRVYTDNEEFGIIISIVVKAILEIDGAVCAEIPLAEILEHSDSTFGETLTWPWYESFCFKLNDTLGASTNVTAVPLNDYAAPTAHDINGVTIATAEVSGEFWEGHYLAGWLMGDVYEPDGSNVISVPFRIMPRYWEAYPNSVLPTGPYKAYRGVVHGLALTTENVPASNSTITISTPDASPGDEEIDSRYTDGVGRYESKAVNVKGDAEVESGLPPQTITMRERMWSRLVCTSRRLSLKYCATTGKIAITGDGKPTLTCCD